jgi:AraC-like DNA-binding protein
MNSREPRSRSVSPLIATAVSNALSGAPEASISSELHDKLTATAPPTESVHTRNLQTLLREEGPDATVLAGYKLSKFGHHPILEALASCPDHIDLLHRFSRVEPMLHRGNRTHFELVCNGVDITHIATNNSHIDPAESLFVCGAQVGMLERIGCIGVRATLFSGINLWPCEQQTTSLMSHLAPRTKRFEWFLRWDSAPIGHQNLINGTVSNQVRELVRTNPARKWTLADTAMELHISERTLQRRLRDAGARFSSLVIEARLDDVDSMLLRTNLSIGVIAHLSGFYDHAHLSHCMKTLRGKTPTAIRRIPEEEVAVISRALGR